MKVKMLAILIVLLSGIVVAANAGNHSKTIVDTAATAGSFNTLVAAIKAADLADTLNGKGPFTVFAPTDDAFAKLPEGTLGNAAQAGKQSQTAGDSHLPRGTGPGDGQGCG